MLKQYRYYVRIKYIYRKSFFVALKGELSASDIFRFDNCILSNLKMSLCVTGNTCAFYLFHWEHIYDIVHLCIHVHTNIILLGNT